MSIVPITRQSAIIKSLQAENAARRQQQAITSQVQRLATVAVISNALESSSMRPATSFDVIEQERLQKTKINALNGAAEHIQSGKKINSTDIDNIGKFINLLSPSGGIGSQLDQSDVFSRGNVSRFGNRTGGVNTVDTHEHYRVSRELTRLKQEALQVRLNTEARETEVYRQARSRELIDLNVRLQTLSLAR